MRLLSLLAPLPPAAAVLLAGCSVHFDWHGFGDPDVWVEERQPIDVPAGDLERVAVLTHNGAITVCAGPPGADTVQVTAIKRAGGDDEADAREALSCLDVARRKDGSTFELQAEWAREPRSSWGSCVSFEIALPPRLAARLESHNGEVTVDGLEGDLEVLTHNGPLKLDAASRRVAATTRNGSIEYCGPAERIEVQTHNGWVKATLTGGPVSGRIGTHNGGVVIEAGESVRGTIEGDTRNGSVSITARSAGCTIRDDGFRIEFVDPGCGRLEVSTRNGSIEVR
jgi:hypothetical protein